MAGRFLVLRPLQVRITPDMQGPHGVTLLESAAIYTLAAHTELL